MQRFSAGTRRSAPSSLAIRAIASRSGPFAATPPVTTTQRAPVAVSACRVTSTSAVTIAFWNEAATSAGVASGLTSPPGIKCTAAPSV